MQIDKKPRVDVAEDVTEGFGDTYFAQIQSNSSLLHVRDLKHAATQERVKYPDLGMSADPRLQHKTDLNAHYCVV